jgi:hypothetical protein
VDFALFERLPIREGLQTQFRWELFNFVNHANFAAPVANYAWSPSRVSGAARFLG